MNVHTGEKNAADVTLAESAAQAIRSGEYSLARSILRQAAAVDMEDPELYNLLGISYEKDGDRLKASRFYRVAYYMDQTFRPAALNLERVSEFAYQGSREIECGLNITGGKKV